MIAMLKVDHPGHAFKQVVQAFTQSDIPKRDEAIKEIASLGYFDESGGHAIFLFDVPDGLMSQFALTQSKRTAFISARAPGFTCSVQYGQKVSEAISSLLPMYP